MRGKSLIVVLHVVKITWKLYQSIVNAAGSLRPWLFKHSRMRTTETDDLNIGSNIIHTLCEWNKKSNEWSTLYCSLVRISSYLTWGDDNAKQTNIWAICINFQWPVVTCMMKWWIRAILMPLVCLESAPLRFSFSDSDYSVVWLVKLLDPNQVTSQIVALDRWRLL